MSDFQRQGNIVKPGVHPRPCSKQNYWFPCKFAVQQTPCAYTQTLGFSLILKVCLTFEETQISCPKGLAKHLRVVVLMPAIIWTWLRFLISTYMLLKRKTDKIKKTQQQTKQKQTHTPTQHNNTSKPPKPESAFCLDSTYWRCYFSSSCLNKAC